MPPRKRIFLLSPANLSGVRAGYLLVDNAKSNLACRLRSGGVALGEVFAFISGLYFRGKLVYAQSFCASPDDLPGLFVITSSEGLLVPDALVTLERLQEWAAYRIDAGEKHFRVPLERDCRLLSSRMGESCDVVLLGSIATAKYASPLLEIFRERLLFPADFVGRGDMSRGGLMLRSFATGKELEYIPVLNATLRGPRPPRLLPVKARPPSMR